MKEDELKIFIADEIIKYMGSSSQEIAWNVVYDLCIQLGMSSGKYKSGLENVCSFINGLFEISWSKK